MSNLIPESDGQLLIQQLRNIADLLEKTEPWLNEIYKPILHKVIICIQMDISLDKLESIRHELHLTNSSISGMGRHGSASLDDGIIFGYIYSIHDLLHEYIEMNGGLDE